VSKTLQVREVPQAVHDALVRLASSEGLSLSAFLRRELGRIARQRRLEEVFAEINERLGPDGGTPPEEAVDIIEQARAERLG